ncbi:SPOR domain-containing protein [Polynucleobacter difficilis]|uniref:SPOR domain-containing protein n=1 Tax=Polynucleobacter difficilis TaxID=556054 RepID=UPI000D3821C8|nr:SPOR domain-containing protein [Polynucleobacter difficilis]
MIRLSQLFKRDSQPDDGLRASSTRSRADAKLNSRSSRASADDPVLTEDPEHQRARHRLIGAAVLVLIAIIVLPRVLDSKPKSVSNDIAITIVSNLPAVVSPQPTPSASAEPKSEEAKATIKPVVPAAAAPAPAMDAKESSKATPSAPAKAVAPSSADKTMGLAAGEEIVVAAKSATPDTASAAASSTGKFVIQIGAFASEERANGWIAKLKEQKIPNYVLNRTGADGSKLLALRAGPFSDKETAEAAEKKIKAMGLTPRIVEVGKQ